MATKMVTDRSAEASFVDAAAKTFLREVSPSLDQTLSPLLEEGESLPDLTLLPKLAVRLVDSRLEQLIEADKANIDAQAALIEPRKRRDDAADGLSETLFGLRDVARGLYGRKMVARILPGDQTIPRRPKALLHDAEHVLERLLDPDQNRPSHKLEGILIEPGQLAVSLEPAKSELDLALGEVDVKRREAQITQAAKDEAMAEFSTAYRASIRLLEALSSIAGKPALAERVRPTRRRKSAKPEDEEAGTEASPDEQGEATAATG